MASNNKQGGGGIKAVGGHDHQDEEIDPKFECLVNANNFLLRLTLTGFKKEDIMVQVDGTGKLTVRGQRSSAGGGNKQQNNNSVVRFHKVFQLPSNANVGDITGRFEANVLTITVPKRPSSASAPPATVQEIKQHAIKQQQQEDDNESKKKKKKLQEEEEAKKKKKKLQEEEEATAKKKKQEEEDETRKKKLEEELQLARKKKLEEEEEARKKAQQKKKKEEEDIMAKRSGKQDEQKPTERKAAAPAGVVDGESLAEKVKRRAEEERAKAAAAAEAAEERTATALNGWRERVAGELENLADMRWADGAVEAVRNNKEVIATAVAAFSIGFFLSQKIFCRR